MLLSAYWRGIFDGDGSIYITKSNRTERLSWGLSLVGNEFIVSEFQQYVARFSSSKAQIYYRGKTCSINYGGIGLPRLIVKVLYEDAIVYLDRKYALAQKLIAS